MKRPSYLHVLTFSFISFLASAGFCDFESGPQGYGYYSSPTVCLTCSSPDSGIASKGPGHSYPKAAEIAEVLIEQNAAQYKDICQKALKDWNFLQQQAQSKLQKIENIKTVGEAFVAKLANLTANELELIKEVNPESGLITQGKNKMRGVHLVDVYFKSNTDSNVCRLEVQNYNHNFFILTGCWNSKSEPIYTMEKDPQFDLISPSIMKVRLPSGPIAKFQRSMHVKGIAVGLKQEVVSTWQAPVERELLNLNKKLSGTEIRILTEAYLKGEACPE